MKTKMVIIEVQDQHGKWQRFCEKTNSPSSVKQGLEAALNTAFGKKSGRARAIDKDTKQIVDIIYKENKITSSCCKIFAARF